MRCISKIKIVNKYKPIIETDIVEYNHKTKKNVVTGKTREEPTYCKIGEKLDIISDKKTIEELGNYYFGDIIKISVINELGELFTIRLDDVEKIEYGYFKHIPYYISYCSTIQIEEISKPIENDVYSTNDYRYKYDLTDEDIDNWFKL